jgi:hypothetical protein
MQPSWRSILTYTLEEESVKVTGDYRTTICCLHSPAASFCRISAFRYNPVTLINQRTLMTCCLTDQ